MRRLSECKRSLDAWTTRVIEMSSVPARRSRLNRSISISQARRVVVPVKHRPFEYRALTMDASIVLPCHIAGPA